MKIAIAELTMPNAGSWNGKFSGSGNTYTKKIRLLKTEEHLIGKNFYYNFGDGWGANVSIRLKEPKEKATERFMGYDWMVSSILKNGKIIIE